MLADCQGVTQFVVTFALAADATANTSNVLQRLTHLE